MIDPSGYVENPLPNADRIQGIRDLISSLEAELHDAKLQLYYEEARVQYEQLVRQEGGAA